METVRKARKDYICEICNKTINKGEIYVLHELKGPVYEDSGDPEFNGKQVSVWFHKIKQHLPQLNCGWPQECKDGNHSIVEYFDADPNSETCGQTFKYCDNCGTDKATINQST